MFYLLLLMGLSFRYLFFPSWLCTVRNALVKKMRAVFGIFLLAFQCLPPPPSLPPKRALSVFLGPFVSPISIQVSDLTHGP